MLTPETTQSAIMFLISVGSLAASELKERWSLRRLASAAELDLSKQEQVEQKAEPVIRELLSQKSNDDVRRTLDLVERKRALIYDAQREKLNAEVEYNEGRITLNMLQLRKEKCDQQIKDKLTEIEGDLSALGLNVDKQAI